MASRFLYTITTGRSGTAYLADLVKENVPDATVYHERINFDSFGVHTPDISHLMLFNNLGNVKEVRGFWRRKLTSDATAPSTWYVESSHMLAKAGLLENLNTLCDSYGEVDVVVLRRSPFDVFWSFIDRGDFYLLGGHTWLHWLDPRYHNRIVDPKPFMTAGEWGVALWYISEVLVRSEYYKLLLADSPGIRLHEAWLERLVEWDGATDLLRRLGMDLGADRASAVPRSNGRGSDRLPGDMRARARLFFDDWSCDSATLAQNFYEKGGRLSAGARVFRERVIL